MVKIVSAFLLVMLFVVNSYGDVLFEMDQKGPSSDAASRSEGKVKGVEYKAGLL